VKKTIITIGMLLACGVWVLAQQSYPSSSSQTTQSQTQSNASNKTSVQGCLSGSAGNYTLTDSSGTKYQLSGDTSKLSAHVGHEVQITGTTSQSGTPSSTASGTSSSTGQQTLNVSGVKHISSTCSSSSSTKPPE
jgi:hypothetical protein